MLRALDPAMSQRLWKPHQRDGPVMPQMPLDHPLWDVVSSSTARSFHILYI